MKKVAIIGAGFTGLTAGYELAKKGVDVTIFEKSSDIGGLAGGFTLEGASLEKAYHHLFRTDTAILSLLDELGLSKELGWYESKVGMIVKSIKYKDLKHKEDTEHNLFEVLPFIGVKDLLMYKPLPVLDRVRAGAVVFFLQKYNGWKTLIDKPAFAWMQKWSGKKVMDTIWGPLLQGKFSSYASKVSMAWLWARIHIRANSRKSIFEKELLAYPRRGFLSIAETLATKISANQNKTAADAIQTNTAIEQITYSNNKATIFYNNKHKVFDAVLSTIPEKAFLSLVKNNPSTPTNAKQPINYLSAIVLAFSSPQSLSKFYWHNIIDKESPFIVFLQHTNLVPKKWYNDQNVYYIGVYVPNDYKYFTDQKYQEDGIKQEWFAYLKQLFPAFDEAQVANSTLFKFPYAQHVVDTKYPEKIPAYKTNFPNTYLANFSQIFPEDRGTNYAVLEGQKIAALISSDLLQ
ncbi:hypothetical protein CO112_03815 [Candidatus Dojkabacteria bacterium CG_4_9_14_3_um_filter_150_Dojkabacteria_WS6_41_13]|uniref:Amine oxidase domain-containing protein n=1 Tax=Candidatus Dojkabacteria bacterium CG_4_10_14_0_2_um_filter_Dojkabacteria_WS6_41_15 TaxID=2014249 RepID=A0A2M7W1T2_9BACT|nr:MAG: hypothetical protein COX64_02965 [Candidatus Dojkabacteria bacterium CG_4_10_14_0_2_um_filter_Dojkabacteria_WS6_41_15]PJB22544.1 MAG: hypothetical protein CO112_03815 [Candidatus Dojkabacteria bacterium CG_4_9_14_3_um_filter_150_Dojkabacteria_WS6_41_13]